MAPITRGMPNVSTESLKPGSVFINQSEKHSLSFSSRFVNLNAFGLASHKLCHIQMLLTIGTICKTRLKQF